MVYGNKHHFLTRKIDFTVIASFIIDRPVWIILISFYKTDVYLIYAIMYSQKKNFGTLILESSGHKKSAANLRKLG